MPVVSRTRWPPLGSHSTPGPRSTPRHGHAEVTRRQDTTSDTDERANKRDASHTMLPSNNILITEVSVSRNPVSKPQNGSLIRQALGEKHSSDKLSET